MLRHARGVARARAATYWYRGGQSGGCEHAYTHTESFQSCPGWEPSCALSSRQAWGQQPHEQSRDKHSQQGRRGRRTENTARGDSYRDQTRNRLHLELAELVHMRRHKVLDRCELQREVNRVAAGGNVVLRVVLCYKRDQGAMNAQSVRGHQTRLKPRWWTGDRTATSSIKSISCDEYSYEIDWGSSLRAPPVSPADSARFDKPLRHAPSKIRS